MKEFEYCLLRDFKGLRASGIYLVTPDGEEKMISKNDLTYTHAAVALNELGAQGWEVVGMDTPWKSGPNYNAIWVLKREKVQK